MNQKPESRPNNSGQPSESGGVLIVASHPIQYHAPVFKQLAKCCELTVLFAHKQTPKQQSAAGYGTAFDWGEALIAGYRYRFLNNRAKKPGVDRFNAAHVADAAQWLRLLKPSVVLVMGWNLRVYWQFAVAARRQRIAVCVRGDSTLRSGLVGWRGTLKRLLYRYALRVFDGFLSPSEANRDYLLAMGVAAAEIQPGPYAVPDQFFADPVPKPAKAEADPLEVLFVGRLVPFKRVPRLIAAIAKANTRSNRPIRLTIAGSGPMQTDLAKQAAELQVEINWLGFTPQNLLPRAYRQADLTALVSNGEETFGMVLLESLACRTPVLLTSEVGSAETLATVAGCTVLLSDHPARIGQALEGASQQKVSTDTVKSLRAAHAAKVWLRSLRFIAGNAL